MIIDHVGMIVSDYERSKRFYINILAPLGIKLITEHNGWSGFGKIDTPEFWIGASKAIQQFTHIAFKAENTETIDMFYDIAIREGAISKGEPKVRNDYYLDYYSAYIIDHDGHYIGAALHKTRSLEQPINTTPISSKTAVHYTWGDQCDGWWLKNSGNFTVISESMPPRSSEKLHYHQKTTQFFYSLSGKLSIQLGEQEYTLQEHEGLEIPAAQKHNVQNKTNKTVQFLVISSPNSQEDRVDLELI